MHVAIAAVTMGADGTLNIGNHRERHASITGEILSETEARGCNPLVSGPDLLQFGALLPEPVHAGWQPVDAVSAQIELDELRTAKISQQRLRSGSQNGRELRERHRSRATQEIEGRTPRSSDIAKAARGGSRPRQLDLAGTRGRRPSGRNASRCAAAEFRGVVNRINQRISNCFRGELIGAPGGPNGFAAL